MSELTKCNFCTLKGIKARAKKNGQRVYVRDGKGEFLGWKTVTLSGESKPVAYFMELTGHCVC